MTHFKLHFAVAVMVFGLLTWVIVWSHGHPFYGASACAIAAGVAHWILSGLNQA